jgi:predicted ATPase
MAKNLWFLGYPDQALKRSREALTLAQELAHPYSLVTALGDTANFHQFRREQQTVQERTERIIALTTGQGFPLWSAWVTLQRGRVLVEQGKGEEGISQIHEGLAAWRTTGAEMGMTCHLALLVEAYGKVGQTKEGLSVLVEVLAQVDKTGERFYEAELYRLKGELTLQQFQVPGFKFRKIKSQKAKGKNQKSPIPNPQTEAEACFLKAIEIARRQSAKSWELRVTTSLARLWQQQGKQKQARKLLAEIYGWFTEGFDTKDLQEAKVLLEELAGC